MAKRLRRESAAILANLSRPLSVTGAFLQCAWPVAQHFTSFGVRTGRTRQNDFVQSKGEANALPFKVVSCGSPGGLTPPVAARGDAHPPGRDKRGLSRFLSLLLVLCVVRQIFERVAAVPFSDKGKGQTLAWPRTALP